MILIFLRFNLHRREILTICVFFIFLQILSILEFYTQVFRSSNPTLVRRDKRLKKTILRRRSLLVVVYKNLDISNFTFQCHRKIKQIATLASPWKMTIDQKCFPEQNLEMIESSRRLQTCPSSFDRNELLLNDPEFLENLVVENDGSAVPVVRQLVIDLKTLLRWSKYYLYDNETTSGVHFAFAASQQ